MFILRKCCTRPLNCFHVVAQFSKFGYSSILMPHIQDYIKNSKSLSTQSLKSKEIASAEPQGIHENVFALQTRTRLQRRKRPPLVEEDSRKLGVWYYAGLRNALIAYLTVNLF